MIWSSRIQIVFIQNNGFHFLNFKISNTPTLSSLQALRDYLLFTSQMSMVLCDWTTNK